MHMRFRRGGFASVELELFCRPCRFSEGRGPSCSRHLRDLFSIVQGQYWHFCAIGGALQFLSRSQKVFFEKSQSVDEFERRRKLNCGFAVIVAANESIYACLKGESGVQLFKKIHF